MKITAPIIIIGVVIVGIIIFLWGRGDDKNSTPVKQQENTQNVSMVDGKQIITIKAKGGYTPRVSTAKAGVPSIIRFETNNTFDCSLAIRIPSMNFSGMLSNSGSKDVNLGTPRVGSLKGSCSMGMYPFQINFQE